MDKFKLGDCDYRFMTLVWDHEPIKSGELVKLCLEELGWKKSTTYTIVKKMCEKGLLENKDTIVSAVVPKERVQREETEHFVERTFGGSLPQFVATFLGGKTISKEEAEQLKKLIDSHKEEGL